MQASKTLLANMLLIAICLLPGGPVLAEPGKAVFAPDASSGPRTGSWGDQGDGTYRNPILNADYPDVDVEQVGDTYYMISSKQHMAPGMVILESKDMVNWRTIGHVWNKLSWDPRYNWDRMDGYSYGVWAGDLAYHDGRWYCYQIDNVVGLYMSSSPDIRGPWTEPHLMLANKGRNPSDPAVFWDDKAKQAYLVCRHDLVGGQMVIKLFKMSWDGRELLDEGVEIHRYAGAEAAKIYRIEGKWYIFISQWYFPDPVRPNNPLAYPGDRKQIVLRSKTDSIHGPYEQKIVLQRGNGVIRQCSQGALMRAPDGSWWYTHQLVQRAPSPFEGRPQMLEPVQWVDGWPIIGKDVNGDGIGEPVLHHRKPIQGYAITAPPTDGRFRLAATGPSVGMEPQPARHPLVVDRAARLAAAAGLRAGRQRRLLEGMQYAQPTNHGHGPRRRDGQVRHLGHEAGATRGLRALRRRLSPSRRSRRTGRHQAPVL